MPKTFIILFWVSCKWDSTLVIVRTMLVGAAEPANAEIVRLPLAAKELSELRGVDIVVDEIRVAPSEDIINSHAPGPELSPIFELPLDVEIELGKIRKTLRIDAAENQALFVADRVWEAG